jgi:hypothetical protein
LLFIAFFDTFAVVPITINPLELKKQLLVKIRKRQQPLNIAKAKEQIVVGLLNSGSNRTIQSLETATSNCCYSRCYFNFN